jgi:epoxide hydrolase 4
MYWSIGTTTAAVNYYRALFRHQRDDSHVKIDRPVLILWGCKDAALGQELADASRQYCSDVQMKKIVHASHWIQQDEPDIVNNHMAIFLSGKPPTQLITNE